MIWDRGLKRAQDETHNMVLTEQEKRDVDACPSQEIYLELIKVVGKHTQARGYLNDLGQPTLRTWEKCKDLLYEMIEYKKGQKERTNVHA